MRGLNLLTKKSTSGIWKSHQLISISKAEKNSGKSKTSADSLKIEPLFPGSYLCNQIVFYKSAPVEAEFKEDTMEASLEIIYESLSLSIREQYGSYILIDGVELDEDTSTLLYDVVCLQMSGIATLLVLDESLLHVIKKLFDTTPLKVQSVKPDWSSAAQVLSLYRNSFHCVFIDNCRVMDAAVSGCALTLISSQDFVKQQSTGALWHCLARRSNCRLAGARSSGSAMPAVAVIENNLNDFRRVLNGDPVIEYADWLDEYRTMPVDSKPVIERYVSVWRMPTQGLVDFRLSARRKALKLAEDPKRFCSDSGNPMLKQLSKLFPSRDTA